MFDVEKLKDKLDSETLAELRTHIEDLQGARDTARTESIDGRKALKAKVESLQALNTKMLEKLGIDSPEEIDTLPEAKGQGEALKQFEAKLKRAERERDEALKSRDTLSGEMTQAKRQAAITAALSKGGFHDVEAAELLLSRNIEQQDDAFMFKTKEGRFIPLEDGAKLIATERPHLVKAPQGTGSGFRDAGGYAAKTMPRASFDALRPAQRAEAMAAGYSLVD